MAELPLNNFMYVNPIIPLAILVRFENSRLHCNTDGGEAQSIAQSKGHTFLLIFGDRLSHSRSLERN